MGNKRVCKRCGADISQQIEGVDFCDTCIDWSFQQIKKMTGDE